MNQADKEARERLTRGESVIRNARGDILHTSRNLRGLLEHGRRVGAPVSAYIVQDHAATGSKIGAYVLRLFYPDGSQGWSRFADWRVCGQWLRARRAWQGVRIFSALR